MPSPPGGDALAESKPALAALEHAPRSPTAASARINRMPATLP
jgi:hypothetical protein